MVLYICQLDVSPGITYTSNTPGATRGEGFDGNPEDRRILLVWFKGVLVYFALV